MDEQTFEDPDGIAQCFRDIMRGFASSVALVTTCDSEGRRHGLAATTANSLSMDPPSMLVSVNRSASAFPALAASGLFCLTVLGHGDDAVLARFAATDNRAERFAAGDWRVGRHGLPWLASGVASLFCRTDSHLDYGSHRVLCGRIEEVRGGPAMLAEPLVWRARECCRAVPLAAGDDGRSIIAAGARRS